MAYIDDLQDSWNKLGEYNSFWAVLSNKKEWNKKEFFDTGKTDIKQALDVLKSNDIEINFKGTALDFGCGVGRLTQALGKYFKKAVGVDIAASMIKQAKYLNKLKNVSFKHVTSGDLSDFKNSSVDFIYTDIVLQHMSNSYTKKYIKEMHRILKSKGVLVFQLPSKPATTWKGLLIKTLPTKVLIAMRKGMEMNPIRREEMIEYLTSLEYEIIAVKRDTRPFHKHWHAHFYYVRKP